MIVKENHNPVPSDKFEKAGHDAERKVAYYLKMAFGDEPKLLILHDLRIEFEDGITAQMDHLLIHQFGLIIIESKSVSGKLQVKEDGQWLRWYKDRSTGMQNPIKQARLQGQTLKRVLLNSSKENTRKALEGFPIDVLVTISDSGVFLAHDRAQYPEVCKADQIEDRIKEIVLIRAKNAKETNFRLSDINKTKLAEHLVKIHKPYKPTAISLDVTTPISITTQKSNVEYKKTYGKAGKILDKINSPTDAEHQNVTDAIARTSTRNPTLAQQTTSAYQVFSKPKPSGILGKVAMLFSSPEIKFEHDCTHCKSEKLEIKYGRNYYFLCLNCNKNYPINANCHKCKSSLKIRKEKKQFFAECATCNTSELFHINR